MQDAGIIRNKLKIKGTVTNAQLFMEVQKNSALSTNISGSLPAVRPLTEKEKNDI